MSVRQALYTKNHKKVSDFLDQTFTKDECANFFILLFFQQACFLCLRS